MTYLLAYASSYMSLIFDQFTLLFEFDSTQIYSNENKILISIEMLVHRNTPRFSISLGGLNEYQ